MDIQRVLILHRNFKPFVSNVFARFTNSKTFLGLCKKKTYKDYDIPSMCATNDNLLKTKTTKLVRCATQCTLNRYGASHSRIFVIMPTQKPQNTKSPSHPKANPFGGHAVVGNTTLISGHGIQNHSFDVV
jgi:hypothetical protein